MRTAALMVLAIGALTAMAMAGTDTAPATTNEIIKRLPDLKDVEIAIPWNDFKAMLERMTAPAAPKPKPAPPVDFVLGQAAYTVAVVDRTAQVKGTVDLTVLKEEGWVMVPLVGSDVALGGTQLDGKPAIVVVRDGRYNLVITGSGQHAVTFTAAASVSEDRGRNRFTVRIPQSAGARVTVTVPEKDAAVTVSPSAETASKPGDKEVVVAASLPVTDSFQVEWQKKVEEAERGVAKLYADVSTLVSVGEGFLRSYNRIDYLVLHAGADKFRLGLPANVTVLDVTGDGVRDWKKSTEAGQDVLTVLLTYPVKDRHRLMVTFEQSLGAAPVAAVPVVTVLDVEREKGFIGVAAEANVELAASETTEARPIDVKELPAAVGELARTPLLLGYRYAKQPIRVALEIRRHEDVAVLTTVIDSVTATTMHTESGKRITRLRFLVRNNQRQFLKLRMPQGVEIWSAFVRDRAVKPARDAEGRILLPLEKSAREEAELMAFPLEVVYTEDAAAMPPDGKGTFKAELPAVDVPATSVVWAVFVPEGRKFGPFTGNIRLLDKTETPAAPTPSTAQKMEKIAEAQKDVAQQAPQQAEQLRAQTLAALQRGATPIRISIPERGQLFQFQKLLVTNEPLTIEASWWTRRSIFGL